ncbi:MAG TPA: serine/threonine-protein kinase [Planctomycetota bacterium]|jgi:predicted Ser/Thr protein kinase|nr:serine/threonine-protein kinase [Planctomycetota bacterium]
MTSPQESEPLPDLPPIDDTIGRKAVDVGLITANQLADVLLELSSLRSLSPSVGAALVDKGLLSSAQLDALSGAPLKRLGKYVIVREIGRGGMGVVYEAEDSELDRRVALKMLLGSLHSDPRESALEEERFVREARLSANLPKHPQIIGVYEAGILDGRRFIAMEFIEGQQLSDWRRQGSITLRQQIIVLRDTAMAVDHAHRHGIIHRDLKPANILVDRKNHPHVADFGLAKRTNQSATLSLTSSGMVMGTPAYMSPEQAHGGMKIDLRTDLWSLGVMLYEILTGRPPFDADSPVKILVKTMNDPVPAPSTVLRTPSAAVDSAIEAICMKALSKNPRQRYATARAFAEDLGRWLRGERVSVLTKSSKSVQPAWLVGILAAAVVAGLTAWLALAPSSEELAADRARDLVVQGHRLLKEGRYSDALVKFARALDEDNSNRDAAAGKQTAEERMVAAGRAATPPRPAPPDPAQIRESIIKELAEVDASLAGYRKAENFGQGREFLTQAARRRSEEEWSREIASRLEALRKTVDEGFADLRTKAVAAKKSGNEAGMESAKTRVKNWKWPGLADELDLELAHTREATTSPPPPPSNGEIKAPPGIRAHAPVWGSMNAMNCMAFSPDGKLLFTTAFDETLRIWDIPGRIEHARIPERFSGRSCAFSPDGKWIAAGAINGIIRVWDIAGLRGRTFTGESNQIMGLAFTPDSKRLVSSCADGYLRVWDVGTGLPLKEMNGHPRGALGLALSPDGRFAAVGTGEPILKIWELATGKEVKVFPVAGRSAIFCVSYAPDGKSVAFAGNEGAVYIADPASGGIRALGAYPKQIHSLAWSPDGRTIATASQDPSLRLWDPSSGAYTGFQLESGSFSVAFSPKGDMLAAGAGDWSLRLYDLPPAGK